MTTDKTVQVHPSNAAQLAAWDGNEGAFWAAHADHFDRSVAAYHEVLLEAAAIGPADHVLDVGCGTGQTTRDAARRATAGAALGIDLSSAMLDVARRRAAAEGLGNVVFQQGDAQVHPFGPASFDVVISRMGAMFFADLDVAFGNIARALRPGGRVALLTWRPFIENEWIRELTMALVNRGRPVPSPPPTGGPFSLSVPEDVHALLSRAGFSAIELAPVDGTTWFGADVDEAFTFITGLAGWMMAEHDDAGREEALDALRSSLERHAGDDGVRYASAAWLVRAAR